MDITSFVPVSSLIINPKDYKIVQLLGSGNFGSVYLAQEIKTSRLVAVKKIQCQVMSTLQQQYLYREIEVMAQSVHPTLLQLYGYSMPVNGEDTFATIVIEYMSQGSLFQVLEQVRQNQRPAIWTPTIKNIIIIGLAVGMQYLHHKSIIHRDLKPENVLLDDNFEPHLGDFGLSKISQATDQKNNTSSIGTPLYMAPEIFTNAPYDFRVDVYAYGIIVYEILTELNPFSDVTNPMALGIKVCNGERPPIPPTLSPIFTNLIDRCWAQYTIHRPTFDDIVEYLYNPEVLVEGADINKVNEYRSKIVNAENQPKPRSSIEYLENQLAQQNNDLQLMQRSFQETISSYNKNNEKLNRDLISLRKEFSVIQNELKNSLKSCTDLIQLCTQDHQNLNSEVVNVKNQKKYSDERQYATLPRSSGQNIYPDLLMRQRQQQQQQAAQQQQQQQNALTNLSPLIMPGIPLTSSNDNIEGNRSLSPSNSSTPMLLTNNNTKNAPPTASARNNRRNHCQHSRTASSSSLTAVIGIFEKLFHEANGNIVEKGLIAISGTPLTDKDRANLKYIVAEGWNGDWNAASTDNSFIVVDFRNKVFSLETYQIKTYGGIRNGNHLKSWVVEGSENGKYWTLLDKQENCHALNGPNNFVVLKCSVLAKAFKFIRILQDGPSWSGAKGFALNNIEFFGNLK